MKIDGLEIGKKLFTTAIGTIYRVRNTQSEKAGFVTILHEDLSMQDEFVAAFHTCAERSCSISNDNYVAAISHGQENDLHFAVLEKCDLAPLSTLFEKTEVLSISDSISLIETVANILRTAHLEESVHAHLSPQSIFSDLDFKKIKIADFGFGEFIRLLIKANKYQELLDTLPYYSPEFIEGNEPIQRQSDIYSLGVLFYRLLVGEVPWATESLQEYLRKPYQRAVVPPSLKRLEIPVFLDEIVLETLEPAVEDRCPNLSHFLKRIAALKADAHKITTPSFEILESAADTEVTDKILSEDAANREGTDSNQHVPSAQQKELTSGSNDKIEEFSQSAPATPEDISKKSSFEKPDTSNGNDLLEIREEEFVNKDQKEKIRPIIQAPIMPRPREPEPPELDLNKDAIRYITEEVKRDSRSKEDQDRDRAVEEKAIEADRKSESSKFEIQESEPENTSKIANSTTLNKGDENTVQSQEEDPGKATPINQIEILKDFATASAPASERSEEIESELTENTTDSNDDTGVTQIEQTNSQHEVYDTGSPPAEADMSERVGNSSAISRVKKENVGEAHNENSASSNPVEIEIETPIPISAGAKGQPDLNETSGQDILRQKSQQPSVSPPLKVPFTAKDETQTKIVDSNIKKFYRRQFNGYSFTTFLRTLLIALIPILAIYLLIAMTFDLQLMNRLSSLKERLKISLSKTETPSSDLQKNGRQNNGIAATSIKQSNDTQPFSGPENKSSRNVNSAESIQSQLVTSKEGVLPRQKTSRRQNSGASTGDLQLQLAVRYGNFAQVADVYVNGNRYGKTDRRGRILLSNLSLNKPYLIKVQKPGFAMWAQEVTFKNAGTRNLNVALKPLPSSASTNGSKNNASVTVLLSNPQNVSHGFVYINGKLWEGGDNVAPAKIQLPPGTYKVEVKSDGYRSHPSSQSLRLTSGENQTVYFYLTPLTKASS